MEKGIKLGINSNTLKIIAIIVMIIDHIGTYFIGFLNTDLYYIFKSVGRTAMPIFVYLLIQGFFHTKDIKKYIFRIFCLATITQIVLLCMGIINELKFQWYSNGVNNYLGILYSYTLSLILLAVINNKKIFPKLGNILNIIIKIISIIGIMLIYIFVKIEFDLRIPFMFLGLYAVEKIFMDKENKILFSKREFKTNTEKIIYILFITLVLGASLLMSYYNPGYKYALLFAIIPIALYNGKRGKKSKIIQTSFYAIFPIQHVILYTLAMIL